MAARTHPELDDGAQGQSLMQGVRRPPTHCGSQQQPVATRDGSSCGVWGVGRNKTTQAKEGAS
jgi:hypothetical protein